eukprot:484828-Prymnesium_polylepis.1
MRPPEASDIMLTTQPTTYDLISCNNPSGPTGSHPGLVPPSCAPIMHPRRRRPHHPLADRPVPRGWH